VAARLVEPTDLVTSGDRRPARRGHLQRLVGGPDPSRLLPYWDVAARPAAPAVPDAAAGPAIAETFTRLRGADAAPVIEAADAARRAGPARESRPLPPGLTLAIAALGAMLAGGAFVAVTRWVR